MRIQAVYCRCIGKRGFGASAVKELLGFRAVKTVVYVIKPTVAVVILTLPSYGIERTYSVRVLDDLAAAPSVVLIGRNFFVFIEHRTYIVSRVLYEEIRISVCGRKKSYYPFRIVNIPYYFSVSVFSKQLCSVVIVLRCLASRFLSESQSARIVFVLRVSYLFEQISALPLYFR